MTNSGRALGGSKCRDQVSDAPLQLASVTTAVVAKGKLRLCINSAGLWLSKRVYDRQAIGIDIAAGQFLFRDHLLSSRGVTFERLRV